MKGLLNRKYVDMTVGDMLKLSGGVTLASLVLWALVLPLLMRMRRQKTRKWRFTDK